MKSAIQTTVLMGLLAAIFAGTAVWCYPWPERIAENAQVNKPLFDDYDTSSVREIEIVTYDEDRSDVERLRLKRKGERWVIPQKSGFDVTGGNQVIQVVKALNDRTVLEVNSDSQNDHVEYGVVDPSSANGATSRASLGKRMVLSDRNRKPIGSLIVGKLVKGSQDKHYVRIPGKPTVYTVEFDDAILTTDFSKWTSPNLLGLPVDSRSAVAIDQFKLSKYRLGGRNVEKVEDFYELEYSIDREKNTIAVDTAKVKGEAVDSQKIPANFLQKIAPRLFELPIANVVNQSKEVVEVLRSSTDAVGNAVVKALENSGFFYTGYENRGHQFKSSNGELTVRLSDGVRYHIHIGGLANEVGGDSLTLLYQVMLTADVDEKVFPKIEKPEDAEEDEAVKKVWLRAVKKRDNEIALAVQSAKEFNRKHSSWVYVMDESVIGGLLPEMQVGR